MQTKTEEKKLEFDYEMQVWVSCGVVMDCGHDVQFRDCCNARKYRGLILERVKNGKEK